MFRNMKIGAKLIFSFILVVVIFGAICVYMVVNFGSLSRLQDEGAGRANDAVEINRAVVGLIDLYPVIADAVINRNFDETRENFGVKKAELNAAFTRVKGLVDTEEELALADEYITAASEYMDIFENYMFPVLEENDTVAARADDSLNIMHIKLELSEIYAVIADAVINGNMEETRRDLNVILAQAEESILHLDAMVDTEEEIQAAADFKKAYQDYVGFFENTMFPEIIAGADMVRIRVLDAQVDRLRDQADEILHLISTSLNQETQEAIQAEQSVRDYDGQIDVIRDVAIAALNKIEVSLKAEQDDADEAFDSVIQQTILLAIIVSIIGVIIALVLALVITRSIRKPIIKCVEVADTLSKGDLTVEIGETSKDEKRQLLAAMNQMVESLRDVVTSVQSSADYVSSGSHQNATASEEMASTSEELSSQADSLLEAIQFFTISGNVNGGKRKSSVKQISKVTATTRKDDTTHATAGKQAENE